MYRCPKCQRFGFEYNSMLEKCAWNDCAWINREGIDLSKIEYPIKFHEFIKSIKIKRSFDETNKI